MGPTVKRAVKTRMPTSGVGKSNDPFGFTLVELAVVVLILAVSLGLVLPEVSSGLWRNELKASSRRLAGAVAQARCRAMLEGRYWELCLDLDAGTFWTAPLREADAAQPDAVTERSLVGEVRFMDVHTSHREIRRSGRTALRFHPQGLAEPAVIHLLGEDREVQTLVVKPCSSRSAVYTGYREAGEAGTP
jgi:type II secretion system protein H